MATPLTTPELELLEFLNKDDGAYQFNTWAITAGDIFGKARDLQSLKRRGLVNGEGRGNARQWWITDEGKQRLAAEKPPEPAEPHDPAPQNATPEKGED